MESASLYIFIILYVIAFLVIAFALKKYQRTVLWIGALILFFITMLSIGLGLYVPKGFAGVLQPCLALVVSGLMILVAEKQNSIKLANDANYAGENNNDNQEDSDDIDLGIELPDKLNTPLARRIIKRAIADEFMEVQDGTLKWNKSVVLLAYVCGRIYCGDKPEFQKRKQKYYWRLGKGGRFPDGLLQALFGVKNLGGARQKNRDTTVPDGAELVDKWF